MMVDISHVSAKTMHDALDITAAPGDLFALVGVGPWPTAAATCRTMCSSGCTKKMAS